jgi:hypothetical protein
MMLGRPFGLAAVLIFAPVMGLLALMLKLSGIKHVVRDQLWLTESRHVRTKRFVTPANGLGQFLRENHLDHLPALLDLAAGRVRLLVACEDRLEVRVALEAESHPDQLRRSETAPASIAARQK